MTTTTPAPDELTTLRAQLAQAQAHIAELEARNNAEAASFGASASAFAQAVLVLAMQGLADAAIIKDQVYTYKHSLAALAQLSEAARNDRHALAQAQAGATNLRAWLAEIQWSGGNDEPPRCPACKSAKPGSDHYGDTGHRPDCWLDAAKAGRPLPLAPEYFVIINAAGQETGVIEGAGTQKEVLASEPDVTFRPISRDEFDAFPV